MITKREFIDRYQRQTTDLHDEMKDISKRINRDCLAGKDTSELSADRHVYLVRQQVLTQVLRDADAIAVHGVANDPRRIIVDVVGGLVSCVTNVPADTTVVVRDYDLGSTYASTDQLEDDGRIGYINPASDKLAAVTIWRGND